MSTVLLFVGGLILLFMLGFGAPYAIGIVSDLSLILNNGFANFPYHTVAQKFINSGNSFTLMAIPFFLLAGNLMNTGGITRRIFKFCQTAVGWIPGGLAHANILSSIVFAGMSGSAVADAAGLGTIEIRAMEDQGFDTEFSAAITAASSTIGPIIPPSIPLIVYATTAGTVAVSKMLMAGLVPGILMGVTLAVMVVIISLKRHYPKSPFPKGKVLWDDFRHAFLSLLTPVILIGGMLSGIFTPTEAAIICVVYAFILTVIIYREVTLKQVGKAIMTTAKESACIVFIICASNLYGYLLTRARIPQTLVTLISGMTSSPLVVLLLINVLFLIIGCFMDCNAAIMVMTPALMPLVTAFGIDPIHFGLIMVLNLMIGLLTPPVGMCLYTTARVAKIPLDKMIKAVAPFYVPLLITLLLVTIFPQIVLLIPHLM
ncbi:MAG: TRAP transporter large permease [Oscillospiraceae bacterium]|nr:TRAP transporter large permease [Oscillospiraceae bacterium]